MASLFKVNVIGAGVKYISAEQWRVAWTMSRGCVRTEDPVTGDFTGEYTWQRIQRLCKNCGYPSEQHMPDYGMHCLFGPGSYVLWGPS